MPWLNCVTQLLNWDLPHLSAGAFIGEHSYSRPNMPVAAGRPDADDLQKAEQFGRESLKKLQENTFPLPSFFIKGNIPYKPLPAGNNATPVCNDLCYACGNCIEVCPTHAIYLSADGSQIETIAKRCIRCCACVKECPTGARIFDSPFTAILHEKFSARREPETFYKQIMTIHKDKRVLVGMSGGIDSSAVCIMLQEQGYEVVGVTMRTWDVPSHFSTPGQEQPDEVLEAQALAARLGIEHHVADVREEFRQVIVKYFIDEYMRGRTPNPCVMCNPCSRNVSSANGPIVRTAPGLPQATTASLKTVMATVIF